MASIHIPGLRDKLEALITVKVAADWPSLAACFGVAPGTLYWWHNGSLTHERDYLPSKHYQTLQKLILDAAPHLPPDTIPALLEGPYEHFIDALELTSSHALLAFIEKEGERGAAKLVRHSREIGLVTIEEENSLPAQTVRQGELFRIEVPARHDLPHALAVQNDGHAWGVIVPARKEMEARLYIPGLRADQTPAFMKEESSLGFHRFACFQTAEPFPASIKDYQQERTALDKKGLETLAYFLIGREPGRRVCHLLELIVAPFGKSGDA